MPIGHIKSLKNGKEKIIRLLINEKEKREALGGHALLLEGLLRCENDT